MRIDSTRFTMLGRIAPLILFREKREREGEYTRPTDDFGRGETKKGGLPVARGSGEEQGDDDATAIWESNISDLTAPFRRNIRNCGRVIDGQCVFCERMLGGINSSPFKTAARLKGRRR